MKALIAVLVGAMMWADATAADLRAMSSNQKSAEAKAIAQKSGTKGWEKVLFEITDRSQPLGDDRQVGGAYIEAGKSMLGEKYTSPTIILSEAAFKSSGLLEEVVRHELLHYTIDQYGPPPTLQKAWDDFKVGVGDKFDLSTLPVSLQQGVQEVLFASAQNYLEHIYITDQLLKDAKTVANLATQVDDIKATATLYKSDYKGFLSRDQKILAKDGKTYVLKPIATSKDPHGTTKQVDISGSYECVEGQYCQPSGERAVESGSPNCPSRQYLSPLTVEQTGNQIVVRQTSRMWTEACTQQSPTGEIWQTDKIETIIESVGKGMVVGSRAVVEYHTVTRFSGTHVVSTYQGQQVSGPRDLPPSTNEAVVQATLEILGPGRLRLVGDSYSAVYERSSRK